MAKIRLQGEEEKRKNIYFEVDTADQPIGEGGMGKVMRGVCVDMATNVSRPVAIKFLYDDLPAHAIERARREASIRLRNDNLVEMLGFIEVEAGAKKHYHVVSELLHGVSLSDVLAGKCAGSDGKERLFHAGVNLSDPIREAGLMEELEDGSGYRAARSSATIVVGSSLRISHDQVSQGDEVQGVEIWFDSEDNNIDIEV